MLFFLLSNVLLGDMIVFFIVLHVCVFSLSIHSISLVFSIYVSVWSLTSFVSDHLYITCVLRVYPTLHAMQYYDVNMNKFLFIFFFFRGKNANNHWSNMFLCIHLLTCFVLRLFCSMFIVYTCSNVRSDSMKKNVTQILSSKDLE